METTNCLEGPEPVLAMASQTVITVQPQFSAAQQPVGSGKQGCWTAAPIAVYAEQLLPDVRSHRSQLAFPPLYLHPSAKSTSHCPTGLCGMFCFFCLNCQVAGDIDECCLCGSSVAMRTLYRTRYNIPGSILRDFCSIWCCTPCALCQLKRDINRRRAMGIFWYLGVLALLCHCCTAPVPSRGLPFLWHLTPDTGLQQCQSSNG
ncbi:hypothetical protein EK904_000692 [Melospiza melodia maxima]|nr:hypothetical protein EK904_000692 [Melospiza melodia maxima]